MRLSVCLIARNEEINLPRALSSVAEVADEIVVADTGSTDRTPQIASERGARVVHFPWCDDFSAARNHALDHATGDWILWLDADEELLPESHPELRQSLEVDSAMAYMILRRDLASLDDPNAFTEMWQLRLFRRRPDLRFRGRCHPDFHPSILEIAKSDGMEVRTSGVTIRHYGYLGPLRESKRRRGARLLELELQDRPGQLYYLIEYARALMASNDPRAPGVLAEAAGILLQRASEPRAPMPPAALLLETLLQLPPHELPTGWTNALARDLSHRWFPESAPLVWIRAQQAFDAGHFEEAETLLRQLVQMGRTRNYDRHTSFDPRIIGPDALLNLGVCCVRQAKLDTAEKVFKQLLSARERVSEARANLETIRRLRRKVVPRRTSGRSRRK